MNTNSNHQIESVMKYTTTPDWYIALDGLTLTASLISTCVSVAFLFTVTIHRRARRSVDNLIACNTQLALLFLSGITLYSVSTVLNSDLYNAKILGTLCIWRSYFVYTEIASMYYSFATEAYYRYMRVVHASRPWYLSVKILYIIMVIQWIVIHAVMLFLPLSGQIAFDAGSQMCSVLLSNYWIIWFMIVLIYMPPWNTIILVYIRLAIIIKKSLMRAASLTMRNARRELTVVKRMILILFIFSVSGVPYVIFAILALIDKAMLPVYYYRIITCFNAVTLAIASSTLLMQSTDVRQTIVSFIMMGNKCLVHPFPARVPRVHALF